MKEDIYSAPDTGPMSLVFSKAKQHVMCVLDQLPVNLGRRRTGSIERQLCHMSLKRYVGETLPNSCGHFDRLVGPPLQ